MQPTRHGGLGEVLALPFGPHSAGEAQADFDQFRPPFFYNRKPQAPDAPHVLMTEGLLDANTPSRTAEALACGARLTPRNPVAHMPEGMEILGVTGKSAPISLNMLLNGGSKRTAVLSQYPQDGHFAIYDNPEATTAYLHFFGLWTAPEGVPIVIK